MIQDFEYYIKNNLVRRTSVNIAQVKSLIDKAEIRLNRIKKENASENESSIVFEDIYESIREAAQSLMQLNGFKPYSHEAVIAFLKKKELLSDKELNDFNRYRILRNKSVYEAEEISIETLKEALTFAEEIIPKIRGLLEKLK